VARICALAGLAALTLAALFSAPEAGAQDPDPTTDRGVVQAVAPPRLVVRALDGSELEFVADDSTRVVLNGVRARLAAIRPGFVAEVVHRGSGRAMRIRAFGRFAGVEQGVIVTAARRELLLERPEGGQIAIPLTRRTRVRRGGVVVGRWALRPGRRATVLLARDGSARVVMLRRQRV
jgi:hypothetical protein